MISGQCRINASQGDVIFRSINRISIIKAIVKLRSACDIACFFLKY